MLSAYESVRCRFCYEYVLRRNIHRHVARNHANISPPQLAPVVAGLLRRPDLHTMDVDMASNNVSSQCPALSTRERRCVVLGAALAVERVCAEFEVFLRGNESGDAVQRIVAQRAADQLRYWRLCPLFNMSEPAASAPALASVPSSVSVAAAGVASVASTSTVTSAASSRPIASVASLTTTGTAPPVSSVTVSSACIPPLVGFDVDDLFGELHGILATPGPWDVASTESIQPAAEPASVSDPGTLGTTPVRQPPVASDVIQASSPDVVLLAPVDDLSSLDLPNSTTDMNSTSRSSGRRSGIVSFVPRRGRDDHRGVGRPVPYDGRAREGRDRRRHDRSEKGHHRR